MARRTIDSPEFTITLSKGLANRHRLPWDHVMKVLREFKAMLDDVGRTIQRENGVQNPTGDFGVQLLATAKGKVFRRGSVDTTAALTMDVANGLLAVNAIINTANAVEKKKEITLDNEKTVRIVRGLTKISEVQRQDHTDFAVKLVGPNIAKKAAKITEIGVQTLQAADAEVLHVDGVTVYGKLLELRDRSQTDEMGECIWGELRSDSGDVWRVQFKRKDFADVIPLFTKQVVVSGDAMYFKTRNPRLDADKFKEDVRRNYLAAFDEMEGADKDLYGNENLEDLIAESRGGED
jgi:hypothetical protein